MRARHPIPRLWLMTDERQGGALLAAVARLPRGAGIVFRHYSLEPEERRRLFDAVRKAARRRGLILLLAGAPRLARAWSADGSHGAAGGGHSSRLIRSASAHDAAELRAAARAGADLVFLSPVFATRSHPGARPLGPVRFGLLAGKARMKVIALGGMDARRARRLAGMNVHGWAAIDAWSDQKRSVVPM